METSYISRACSVYCEGNILKYVQLAAIYNDSKTFVDMPMIYEPEETINAFSQIPDPTNKNALKTFLASYFLPAGSDLVTWIPTDFNPEPKILDQMPDDYPYKQWTSDLNQLWKVLGRNISQAVANNPEKHSFLPRRHPMIVPGGRFRESYYWDSYWIIRGLLVCNMNESAYNVIANLLDDISNFGFVPNGGRVYYLDRSQPPMLSDMVLTYIRYEQQANQGKISTSLQSFINTAYPLLVKEYQWWMTMGNGHVVRLLNPATGTSYTLNRYHSNYTTPRPESYLPDYENYHASGNNSHFYANVRAGAETGWDFSSRWLANHYNLTTIDTSEILPVELNAILYRYEQNMQVLEAQYVAKEFSANSGINFTLAARQRAEAITAYLWDTTSSHWRDYNLTAQSQMRHFPVQVDGQQYASIAYWLPLWAGLCPPSDGSSSSMSDKIVHSLQSSGLVRVGGVATTSLMTNQQWDAPNAWAPLVLMTIEGLRSLNTSYATSLASNITTAWLGTGYTAYEKTGYMYEKYNADVFGVGGGGGEYTPQIGFGWSNGVALVLINDTYASFVSSLSSSTDSNDAKMTLIIVLSVTLPVIVIGIILAVGYYFFGVMKSTAVAGSSTTSAATAAGKHGGGDNELLSIVEEQANPMR